jgi:hypothetical protein
MPSGVTFADIDELSGGLATPYCPSNVVTRAAFKSGTEPTMPCLPHTAPPPPTVVPMYDEFGNLIITDTAMMTDTTGTTGTSVPPDSTLTGGVFQPPPQKVPPPLPPPTTTTQEPLPEPPTQTDTRGDPNAV